MAKTQFDKVIFKNVKFENIMEDIYNNSKKKAVDIDAMIIELRKLIETPQDAMLIVPLIAGYLGHGIDNDSQLIKMAQIIQRVFSREAATNPDAGINTMFNEHELKELEALSKNMLPEMPVTIPIPINVVTKTNNPQQSTEQ